MAVLVKERTALPGEAYGPPSHTGTESLPGATGGVLRSLLVWLSVAGGFVLGLVLTLLGLLTSVALVACLIAAPFIALALTVLLFALAIQAAPFIIPALLGLLLLALATEAAGWWSRAPQA
jgi:hypothetical protein